MTKQMPLFILMIFIISLICGCIQNFEETVDYSFEIDIYESDKAWPGTTLFPDNHNPNQPRVLEVNMDGEIIWEYILPDDLKHYTNPGFDVEILSNANILLALPLKGVYEIDRTGSIVWSYLDPKVSHDADRLPNDNTLIVFGNEDTKEDAQIKEVNSEGEIVWSWYAKDYFDTAPYSDISRNGWTHTNAVVRLENNNTLISPRNFGFLVEVNSQGTVIRTIGEGVLQRQHDPEVLQNGTILMVNHFTPHEVIEMNPNTSEIIWRYEMPEKTKPVRDANRLPNGNTLITGATVIVEVTSEGEIAWRLKLKDVQFGPEEAASRGFYKAERISQ